MLMATHRHDMIYFVIKYPNLEGRWVSAFLFLMSYAHKTIAKKGKVGVEVLVQYIAYWVGIVILMFGIDKVANILLGVEKKRLSETSGKHLNRWGKAISVLGLIIMLWFSGKTVRRFKNIIWNGLYSIIFRIPNDNGIYLYKEIKAIHQHNHIADIGTYDSYHFYNSENVGEC